MYKHNTAVRYCSLALSALIAIMIFYFSSQTGNQSSETSGLLIERIFGTFFNKLGINLSDSTVFLFIDHIVRKLAHFSEYTLFGITLSFFFSTFNSRFPVLQLSVCLTGALYAAGDELHQAFVPERSALFSDVLIDTSGVLTGTLLFTAAVFIVAKIKKHQSSK